MLLYIKNYRLFRRFYLLFKTIFSERIFYLYKPKINSVLLMSVPEIFGSKVFNDNVMRQRLPREVYLSLEKTKNLGLSLDPNLAESIASCMKDWAIEMGATHYTHWFQPMTNVTAGKHDAFAVPDKNGNAIMSFSGKSLVRGEPDASSFPSGGLRATFEARGYTAWDPTSPAFVRDGTLYIPTAFCSYTGESLDEKTPLLRSMQAVSEQAIKILRIFGNDKVKRVTQMAGLEQEYFLIDRSLYESRLDLKICGRTLFGAKPPKGQELDDHYCGRIRLKVADFMKDLDRALWEFGIFCQTKHNEAAPAQHEFAALFSSANIAGDHNQLTMEEMRIIAKQHGLACLLHEKPFEYVNGSGKHDNWSLNSDDGKNLFSPSANPATNYQFLVFLCAFLTAVHEYSDLIRASASCPGNDLRLGGYEAPPAIISINLGNSLYNVLKDIAEGHDCTSCSKNYLKTGVDILPSLPQDDSDRNRTSPLAFTGNRFEFRMLGSSQSSAFANVILNTAVTQVLKEFEPILTNASDIQSAVYSIVHKTISEHGAIIFNGNNYSKEWVEEAKKRGLPNISGSVDAFDSLVKEKNLKLFKDNNIFSESECIARHEILLDNYVKVITIEASVMSEMLKRQIIPALIKFAGKISDSYNDMKTAGIDNSEIKSIASQLSEYISELYKDSEKLCDMISHIGTLTSSHDAAIYAQNELRPFMNAIRNVADRAETLTDKSPWPFPTYTDLLFRV